ncbi:MAG: diguanylate cyclase [Nitrospira sp.]|nr:diguanylate cyclase [Nitrospira sp.]
MKMAQDVLNRYQRADKEKIMDQYPLCNLFEITPAEIEARYAFLAITAEDEANLVLLNQVIHDELDAIVAEFYDHLLQFEELRRFLGDRRTLERLQTAQKQYLLSLGQHANHLGYFENRLRIGITHERIGLRQKWFLGGHCILFEIISRRLAKRHGKQSTELLNQLASLKKFFTLDATLVVETYYQSTMQRLEAILQQLAEAQQHLEEVSRLDGLTQVDNRKFLMESLEMEWHRSKRFHRPFTLLLLDLDDFKQINDRHGHVFGDFVLKKAVQVMRKALRPADIIGRYGGEEFAIGLVETDLAHARQIADRIRLKIALTPFAYDNHKASITISVGLATMTPTQNQLEVLIEEADRALYQAKANGRNQVCVELPEHHSPA